MTTTSIRLARIALLASLLSSPAGIPPAEARPARGGNRIAALADLARAVRAEQRTGLAGAVAAATRLSGARPAAVAPYAPPSSVAEAVVLLEAAVARAGTEARASLRGSETTIDRVRRRVDRVMARVLTDPTADRSVGNLGTTAYLVDRDRLARAARDLARAIDAALPALRRAAPPAGAGEVAGCDLVDRPPALCVGGTGENTYSADVALLIDLGGNDVHANSAGGADPLTGLAPGGNGLPASVTIDVAGNDLYSTAVPTKSGSEVAQGAGVLGGIGFLVDAQGNDLYQASGSAGEPDVVAQGAAVAGVGVLADLGGNDSYTVSSNLGAPVVGVRAQGFGTIAALGILLDRGISDDVYSAEAAGEPYLSPTGQTVMPQIWAQSVAVAAGGSAGLFADDGGRDRIALTGSSNSTPEDGEISPSSNISVAGGIGYAGLGGGSLVSMGPGDTQYEVSSSSRGPATLPASSGTIGFAALGGATAVLDAGGNDVYRADSTVEAREEVILRDEAPGCTDCFAYELTVEAAWASQSTMSSASLGGATLLHDVAGNDVYRATSTSSGEALVTDARTTVGSGPGRVVAAGVPGESRNFSQGWGAAAAVGVLQDDVGTDDYRLEADTIGRASAISEVAESEALGDPGFARTEGQGAGFGDFSGLAPGMGALVDGDGSDVYSAVARQTDDVNGALVPGMSGAQGSVVTNGVGLLADLGAGGDQLSVFPDDPACQGTRGKDVWTDCGQGLGAGANVVSGAFLPGLFSLVL